MISNIIYNLGYGFCFVFLRTFFRLRVHDLSNMPRRGPVIVASNHVSRFDPPAIGVSIARKNDIYFIARASLYDNKILGWILKNLHTIPVKKDAQDFESIRVSLKILKDGKALIIFPEGTRSKDGSLKDPELGIGFVACRSKAPIVPVYVKGSEQALPKGSRIPKLARIDVFVGQNISYHIPEANDAKAKDQYRAIAKKVMEEIAKLKEKSDAYNC